MKATLLRATMKVAFYACASGVLLGGTLPQGWARQFRTTNFYVTAPTYELAREIGEAAERFREQLAIEWLGEPMPPWSEPCPIRAKVSPELGAGGATSFLFDRGEVYGWRMNIQGSRERVLDSVLPHEVTHTIFASHFRQPLPRWADEGACTTVEHPSEVDRMKRMLVKFLKSRKGIPFSDLMMMKEYPPEMLPLYAQGHALAEYLIGQKGKRAFLVFLEDGLRDENWPRAIRSHYGYANLLSLQNEWLEWVKQGRPPVDSGGDELLAAAASSAESSGAGSLRSQSPDDTRGLVRVAASEDQRATREVPAHLTRPVARFAEVAREEPSPEPPATAGPPQAEGVREAKVVFEWKRRS